MDSRRNLTRYGRTMQGARVTPAMRPMPAQSWGEYEGECSSADQQLLAPSLAMVYAPKQCFGSLYDLRSALNYGTIFKELNLPFTGKRGC